MSDANELADLLSALDSKSQARPGMPRSCRSFNGSSLAAAPAAPKGLTVGHSSFSETKVAPRSAVKEKLGGQKPMIATAIAAGAAGGGGGGGSAADDLDAIMNNMNFDEDAEVATGFCAQCRKGEPRSCCSEVVSMFAHVA